MKFAKRPLVQARSRANQPLLFLLPRYAHEILIHHE
jgi:hypothetical protein